MSSLSIYKLVFVTQLIAAEGMISYRKKKYPYFALRLVAALSGLYLVAWVFPLPEQIAYTGWYTSGMFLFLFTLCTASLKFLFRIRWSETLFISITAYTIKHFAFVVARLLQVFTGLNGLINLYSAEKVDILHPDRSVVLYAVFSLSVYIFLYAVCYFVIGEKINDSEDMKLNKTHLTVISAFAILVDIVLNSFVVYSGIQNRDVILIESCFNILSCLLVFYVLMNLIEIREVKDENELISQMLEQAKTQYAFHKENIDLINIKCHDIRHMIRGYLGRMDEEEIERINESVSIYETLYHTGNEAVDILLTEKSRICREREISLTCMAECEALGFIKDSDLYALLGNLMENAIEAVSQIEEKDKRCIWMSIRRVKGFMSISIRNNYAGTLQFTKEGLPQSQKKDENYHGYGLKSIYWIVKKYDGDITIDTKDNVFSVSLLFCIP